MAALRMGMRGPLVRRAQSLLNLNQALPRKLSADGTFGGLTHAAVIAFQQSKRLTVDGVVGEETWKALKNHPRATDVARFRVGPQESLADIAATFIGATESLGNRMGDDSRMREIFEADEIHNKKTGVTDGYAWCCALVSLCVQRLLSSSPAFSGVAAPRVASVSSFRTEWAPQQGCLIFTPSSPESPHKGDIVVYTFSHIGIVESTGVGLRTIEGNTNEEGSRDGTTCRRKQRAMSLARCFIRMPTVIIDT
jgi:hypothetical protein